MPKRFFNLTIVTFMIFATSGALANQFISGAPVPVPPVEVPGHPPTPIPTIPHYGYWKPVWDVGTALTTDFLKGDWKVIGRSTTAGCGWVIKDGYDEKTLKNDDGSDFASLTFNDIPSTPNPVFGVQINHLGNKDANQGPYEIAPQEPQFATWSYGGSGPGGIDDQTYYEFACRNSQDQNVICALTLRLAASVTEPSSVACAKDANGVLLVYSRK